MHNTVWRKRRTGHWHSMGQGAGTTGSRRNAAEPGTAEPGTDDVDDDADDDLSLEDQLKAANSEGKRRRLENKELRRENERLRAQLGDNGQSSQSVDGTELVLALIESGLPGNRIRTAMKLIDSSLADPEEAIEQLREEHGFLFEANQRQQQDLPGQGPAHNRDKNRRAYKGDEAELRRRYPALGGGIFGGKMRPYT